MVAVPVGTQARRRWGRLNLEVRQHVPFGEQVVILGSSILFAVFVSSVILVIAGVPAANLFDELVVQTLSDPQNLHGVMEFAAPLMFIGLAAAIAFRTRFWNLGLEGQMIWGGIAATYFSIYHVGPEAIRLPLMTGAGMLAGIVWILIPAMLKLRLGVNEIISTLLLNYIAQYFLIYLLYEPWQDPRDRFPHAPEYAAFERLPETVWGINTGLALAFAVMLAMGWLIHVSRAGIYLRFIEASDRVALAIGVPIRTVTVLALMISGALAALGGVVILTGQEGRLTYSYFDGYGFSGVLIAFLGRNHPLAVLCVAVLIAMLFVTGQNLQVFYQIPGSMVRVIEATVVFCVTASEFFVRHRLHWVR
ncbi:MAG: ABC transporter permease [Alphaproteobacteria bacterium]|nr:ABC transporter permease [Alphaproteobacteria bacterium]